jgi:hypothetical protein
MGVDFLGVTYLPSGFGRAGVRWSFCPLFGQLAMILPHRTVGESARARQGTRKQAIRSPWRSHPQVRESPSHHHRPVPLMTSSSTQRTARTQSAQSRQASTPINADAASGSAPRQAVARPWPLGDATAYAVSASNRKSEPAARAPAATCGTIIAPWPSFHRPAYGRRRCPADRRVAPVRAVRGYRSIDQQSSPTVSARIPESRERSSMMTAFRSISEAVWDDRRLYDNTPGATHDDTSLGRRANALISLRHCASWCSALKP